MGRASIGYILKLRMLISVLYMLILFLFEYMVFRIGRINNIGGKNGILFWLMIVVQVVLFVLLTESINKYSTPMQDIYHKKYILNFGGIASAHIVGVILLTYKPLQMKWYVVWCLFWFAIMCFVLGLHRSIRNDYLDREEDKVWKKIDEYSLKEDELFLEKADAVERSMKKCCIYMLVIGVFFEFFYNPIVAVLFCVANALILWKMFQNPLQEFYQSQNLKKNIMLMLSLDIGVVCFGYLFVFAVYHKIILIDGLSGKGAEELIPFFMISFIPLLRHWGRCNRLVQRMRRKWIL